MSTDKLGWVQLRKDIKTVEWFCNINSQLSTFQMFYYFGQCYLVENDWMNHVPICSSLLTEFETSFGFLVFASFLYSGFITTMEIHRKENWQNAYLFTVSVNYFQSMKINIGPSDIGTIILPTHRPTIYWILSDFNYRSKQFGTFLGIKSRYSKKHSNILLHHAYIDDV